MPELLVGLLVGSVVGGLAAGALAVLARPLFALSATGRGAGDRRARGSAGDRRARAGRPGPAAGHPAGHPPGQPGLPAGVDDAIAVLGGPAVVLDVADEVVRATPAAQAAGLVRGASLAHPELLALVRSARRQGCTADRRLELARGPLGGSERVSLDVRVGPLGAHHVLLLATDQTESARIEEMRRDFVVNVSHELKTPVGALSLLAEAVEGAADDPVAVRRFAGRMGRETLRLTRLVRDIVDLSQLQGRDPVSSPVLVDLLRCVEEAVDRCQLTAEARDVRVDLATDVPHTGAGRDGVGRDVEVYGDGEQLTTAVANLVDNAVRYSEPGTRVAVGVHRGDGVVEVTVKDQGIGIPPAEQRRVFERFFRVDPARSRQTGGTGLGLSIVKHVMARHGGEVLLWSQVGLGSTFTLRLPDRAPPPVVAAGAPGRRSDEEVAAVATGGADEAREGAEVLR